MPVTGVCNQFAVGLALGRQGTSKRNSVVPAASNTLRTKMKKNRVDTQIWPSCVSCAFSSTGILEGTTKRIAVRDRNAFIAFVEVSK